MSPTRSSDRPSAGDCPDFTKLLGQFEGTWESGTVPRLEEYMAAAGGGTAERRTFLDELVKIDLEYRWRRTAQGAAGLLSTAPGPRPRLEDYLARHRELGPLDRLSLALIAWEYRMRRCWGDRPAHAEYAARFISHGVRLHEALRHIDAELAVEEGTDGVPDRPRPPRTPEVTRAPAPGGPEGSLLGSIGIPERAQPITTVAALLEALRQGVLLGPAQREEVARNLQGRFAEPRDLAKELLKRNWLTAYQVNQLLSGRASELVLGPYLLLERLGEGGAGQVFKARHQKMNRVVALKIIRKELLTDAEVVGRFYREIQVVSQLDHPNVVHAYDAGPAGPTHFLAMEYVEGTDLGKLVKQGGPLPVAQACEYIRQAALALQHAHERGLVHRDIKPHNLIMSVRDGLIKVADLGLARLQTAANLEATAALSGVKGTGTLTPENAVMMGTPDYLAPEQALDFHAADIRADIYGLGCTLLYLLTGQPPFPGGTMAVKLLSHQQKEPPALDTLRPDASCLTLVLRRMLAKRPDERYQTPAEVAEAMAPYTRPPGGDDLAIYLEARPGHARGYTIWKFLWKFAQRYKAFTATVLTALLFLAGSSVVNYRAWRETERANKKYQEEHKRTLAAVPAFVAAARLAVDRQRFDNAMTQVDVALAYDPECSEARLLKGQVLIVQKEFVRAKEELGRYLLQQPQDEKTDRLVKLCGRQRPEEVGTLLDFAHVFEQQKIPALADGLLTKHGGSSFEVREKLLKLYQSRIEKSWPGQGVRLTLDAAGIYALTLQGFLQATHLDALEGMPLTELNLSGCLGVRDLTPLKGMPLTVLNLSNCRGVRDLTPLKGMPLTSLYLSYCHQVVDLTPLRAMPLRTLHLLNCGVGDLTPLKGMPLTELNLLACNNVRDLTPLEGMNLTAIHLPDTLKGIRVLRRMEKSLKTVHVWNSAPITAEDFWKRYDKGEFKGYTD